MIRLIKFLLLIAVIGFATFWLVSNNGEVVINWLGYEIVTDIFVIIIFSILSLVLVFVFSMLIARMLSFKVSFIKVLMRGSKSDSHQIEKIEKQNEEAFLNLTKILAFLDEGEVRLARKEYKKFCSKVKNRYILEYLEYRFGYFESDAYHAKRSKKVSGPGPGNSPNNDKGSESYFTFARDKGWSI